MNGLAAHKILKKIALSIVHAHVTHFAVQVTGIVHPKYQPFRWLEYPLRIVGRIYLPQIIINALNHFDKNTKNRIEYYLKNLKTVNVGSYFVDGPGKIMTVRPFFGILYLIVPCLAIFYRINYFSGKVFKIPHLDSNCTIFPKIM